MMCCLAFTWQAYEIVVSDFHSSQTLTRIEEKKLKDMDFPVIFKICPDPGFNITLLREEGYETRSGYFRGESQFNKSIYGWAGHTETCETRDSVENIYHKVQRFPTPDKIIKE